MGAQNAPAAMPRRRNHFTRKAAWQPLQRVVISREAIHRLGPGGRVRRLGEIGRGAGKIVRGPVKLEAYFPELGRHETPEALPLPIAISLRASAPASRILPFDMS